MMMKPKMKMPERIDFDPEPRMRMTEYPGAGCVSFELTPIRGKRAIPEGRLVLLNPCLLKRIG